MNSLDSFIGALVFLVIMGVCVFVCLPLGKVVFEFWMKVFGG